MQETQCDGLGVSGGLGEPRFGLKLWLGSEHLMDDSSSKSWVLFRDLPYLVIVMGFDLCMFMRAAKSQERNKKKIVKEGLYGGLCACRVLGGSFQWGGMCNNRQQIKDRRGIDDRSMEGFAGIRQRSSNFLESCAKIFFLFHKNIAATLFFFF